MRSPESKARQRERQEIRRKEEEIRERDQKAFYDSQPKGGSFRRDISSIPELKYIPYSE